MKGYAHYDGPLQKILHLSTRRWFKTTAHPLAHRERNREQLTHVWPFPTLPAPTQLSLHAFLAYMLPVWCIKVNIRLCLSKQSSMHHCKILKYFFMFLYFCSNPLRYSIKKGKNPTKPTGVMTPARASAHRRTSLQKQMTISKYSKQQMSDELWFD